MGYEDSRYPTNLLYKEPNSFDPRQLYFGQTDKFKDKQNHNITFLSHSTRQNKYLRIM